MGATHIGTTMNEGQPPFVPPAVSVLMAVHNGMPYLPEAVESILGQTFGDFEFIIVDDGSTDGSAEWVRKKATEDPRVRVIKQNKTGLAKALNTGLEIAEGRYIARMDADDISEPTRLARQFEAMEQDSRLAIVGAAVALMTSDGWIYDSKRPPETHANIRSQLLRGNGQALIHPVVMMRKQAIHAVGGYDDRFNSNAGEDLDLFLRLTEYGHAKNLTDLLLDYRQHPQSNNSRYNHLWQDVTRTAVLSALERVGPSAFVHDMFPSPFGFKPKSSALEFAGAAERSGRFKMANRFAMKAFFTSGSRLSALRFLVVLWIRGAFRLLSS